MQTEYMAFLIDRHTDLTKKECIFVYGHILRKGRQVNTLIGHIEVEHVHAQGKPCHVAYVNNMPNVSLLHQPYVILLLLQITKNIIRK